MGERSKYSDALKVAVLAQYDQDGCINRVCKANDLPYNTVKKWVLDRKDGTLDIPDLEGQIAETKKRLIHRSYGIMDRALDIMDQKIDDCNAVQAATVYGILHDKVAIMQGQVAGNGNTTNNLNIMVGSPEEAARLMQRTIDRMHGKGADQPQDVVIDVDSSIISDSETEDETANAVIPTV